MPAPIPTLGEGPLTLRHVVRHAVGMFRYGFARIAVVALILFVPPSLLAAFVEHALVALEREPGALLGVSVLVSIGAAATLRLLGPVVFAGYLDEAVGAGYFHGRQHRMAHVLRSLPWGRLLVADLLVMGGTALLTAAFVIPGLAFYMLVGLVGPVLVQERRGLKASFERTYRLSVTALVPIAILVVIPTIAELAVHEVVFRVLHAYGLGIELLMEWLLAALIGGSIGVVEVALASELMARNAEPVAEGTRPDVKSAPSAG